VIVEYIVLGVILILMGVGQIYLRHFAGTENSDSAGRHPVLTRRGVRGGRIWEGWTAILGFLGVGLGIVLVVLGVLGR
jgi:hypothetical protein